MAAFDHNGHLWAKTKYRIIRAELEGLVWLSGWGRFRDVVLHSRVFYGLRPWHALTQLTWNNALRPAPGQASTSRM